MVSCRSFLKYFLYGAVPLAGVLLYFHLECTRERAETLRNKFWADYSAEQTDCTAELPFIKQGTLATELAIGNSHHWPSLDLNYFHIRTGVHIAPVLALLAHKIGGICFGFFR